MQFSGNGQYFFSSDGPEDQDQGKRKRRDRDDNPERKKFDPGKDIILVVRTEEIAFVITLIVPVDVARLRVCVFVPSRLAQWLGALCNVSRFQFPRHPKSAIGNF